MKIAYLVNQYPQPSHTFIRREIAALEASGVAVDRYTLRRSAASLVDPLDIAENERTRAILEARVWGVALAMLRVMFAGPWTFLRALALAVRLSWRSDTGLLKHLIVLGEACVLRRWLAERPVTHLHAHFGTNSTTVALLCHALGGPPFSFTVHGPEEFDRPAALRLAEKIAHAKFVVAISEFGRSQLCRLCAWSAWSKIHVVHCGLDRQFLSARRHPMPEENQLVCVARLHEQKGLPVLLEATAELVASGSRLQLVIIGDGPLRQALEEQIAFLGLGDVITLAGVCSSREIIKQVQMSRALVLPSFAEGLPVVLMEAFALYRPVLATYVAGVPELVEPGTNGWLVPPGSVAALVSAIREILSETPSRLAEMGAQGAQRVAERHDIVREAAKLKDLFAGDVVLPKPHTRLRRPKICHEVLTR